MIHFESVTEQIRNVLIIVGNFDLDFVLLPIFVLRTSYSPSPLLFTKQTTTITSLFFVPFFRFFFSYIFVLSLLSSLVTLIAHQERVPLLFVQI